MRMHVKHPLRFGSDPVRHRATGCSEDLLADFTRGGTKTFLSSHKQVSSQIPSPQRVKVNEIMK